MEERKTASQLFEELEELRATHRELRRSHDELEKQIRLHQQGPDQVAEILEVMSDLLLVLGPDSTVLRTNPATLKLLGCERDEVVGHPLIHVLGDRSLQARRWTELLSQDEVRDLDLVLRTKTGETVPITFNGSVIRSPDGKVLSTVCVGRDMRETRKLLEEVRASSEAYRQKAEELEESRVKEAELGRELSQAEKFAALGELAGGMAHEINGPLMVIAGNLELLADAPDVATHHQARIETILKASKRCTGIVSKLHGFARTDFNKVEPCSLNEVVVEVLTLFGHALQVDNVSTETRLEPGLPAIQANRGELQQILTNLVLNARDAMPGGGGLTLATRHDADVVEIEVADSGVGIPPEHQTRIFDPFFTTKEMGRGTGLGLSLTRNMVRRARGEIRLESEPGRGSTFTVRFPLGDARLGTGSEEPAIRPEQPGGQRPMRVLVVDDEEGIRDLCQDYLRGDGHEPVEVTSAEEALARLEEEPFDLVVTDLKMPGIGGLSLLRLLHDQRPRLPVLVMTGSIFAIHKEVGDYPNVVGVLRKPFDRSQLRDSLAILGQPLARVLVVDADKIFVEVTCRQIERLGLPVQVLTARNGFEAGQQMETALPDAVILDLLMSPEGIDGIEICWALKSVPRTRGITVIVVTGVADPATLQSARDAGADFVFRKPIEMEDLEPILRAVCKATPRLEQTGSHQAAPSV